LKNIEEFQNENPLRSNYSELAEYRSKNLMSVDGIIIEGGGLESSYSKFVRIVLPNSSMANCNFARKSNSTTSNEIHIKMTKTIQTGEELFAVFKPKEENVFQFKISDKI